MNKFNVFNLPGFYGRIFFGFKTALFGLLVIFFVEAVNGQAHKNPDIQIEIREQTLNKLFAAVGEISGTSDYKVWFKSGTYRWYLNDIQIKLVKDSALFKTVVKVETGFTDYSDTVHGKLGILYDATTNKVLIRVADAPFEIYLRMLGSKIKLADIQLADYFKEPIAFDGPSGMERDLELDMPDGSRRIIRSKANTGKVFVEPGIIRVTSTLGFKRIEESKK